MKRQTYKQTDRQNELYGRHSKVNNFTHLSLIEQGYPSPQINKRPDGQTFTK